MEDIVKNNSEPKLAKAAPAHFLDLKLLLTILLIFVLGIATTILISVFKDSLGTVSSSGSQ